MFFMISIQFSIFFRISSFFPNFPRVAPGWFPGVPGCSRVGPGSLPPKHRKTLVFSLLLPWCSRVFPGCSPGCSRVAPGLLPGWFPGVPGLVPGRYHQNNEKPWFFSLLLPGCSRVFPGCSRVAPWLLPGCSRVAPGLLLGCSRVAPTETSKKHVFFILRGCLLPGCFRVLPDCSRFAPGLLPGRSRVVPDHL